MSFTSGRISCPAWMSAYRYAPSVPENTAQRPPHVWATASHRRRTPSPSSGSVMSTVSPLPAYSAAVWAKTCASSRAARSFAASSSDCIRSTAAKDASGFTDSDCPIWRDCSQQAERWSSARWPHSSSSRTPSRNFCQPMNFTRPTWPLAATWVPQQAHRSAPGNSVRRTGPSRAFLLR